MRVQGLWINPEVSTGGLRVEEVERKTRPSTHQDVQKRRYTEVEAVRGLLPLLLKKFVPRPNVAGARVSWPAQPFDTELGNLSRRVNVLRDLWDVPQPLLPRQPAKQTRTPSETSGSKRTKRRLTFRPRISSSSTLFS